MEMKPKPTETEIKAGEALATAIAKDKRQQAEIAVLADISAKQIQNYQKGYFPKHNMKSVDKLDEILGTNIGEILSEKDVPREKGEANTDNPQVLADFLLTTKQLITGQNLLIEAHKDLTHSNRVLADTQQKLVKQISSDDSSDMIQESELSALLLKLGESLHGKTVETPKKFVAYAMKKLRQIREASEKDNAPVAHQSKTPVHQESQEV